MEEKKHGDKISSTGNLCHSVTFDTHSTQWSHHWINLHSYKGWAEQFMLYQWHSDCPQYTSTVSAWSAQTASQLYGLKLLSSWTISIWHRNGLSAFVTKLQLTFELSYAETMWANLRSTGFIVSNCACAASVGWSLQVNFTKAHHHASAVGAVAALWPYTRLASRVQANASRTK